MGYFTGYSWRTTEESEVQEFVNEEEEKEYLEENN
jgi:hypothetical protein